MPGWRGLMPGLVPGSIPGGPGMTPGSMPEDIPGNSSSSSSNRTSRLSAVTIRDRKCCCGCVDDARLVHVQSTTSNNNDCRSRSRSMDTIFALRVEQLHKLKKNSTLRKVMSSSFVAQSLNLQLCHVTPVITIHAACFRCGICRCVIYSCSSLLFEKNPAGITKRLIGFLGVIFRCNKRRQYPQVCSTRMTNRLTSQRMVVSSSQTSSASSFSGVTQAGATLTAAAFN